MHIDPAALLSQPTHPVPDPTQPTKAVIAATTAHLKRDARVGVFVGLLLWTLTLYGDGAHHALDQVYEEFIYLHPLIWILAATSICYLNAFQGADLVEDIGALVKPILQFVAHPSGVGIGLVPVLMLAQGMPKVPRGNPWLAVVLVWFLPVLLACLSHFGLAIAAKDGPRASRQQVRLFAGLAVLGTFAVFYFARMDLTAKHAVQWFPAAVGDVSSYVWSSICSWYQTAAAWL